MRRFWKAKYIMPLAMATTLGMTPLLQAQEGVPAEAEVEAEAETTVEQAEVEADVEAELEGEAPEVEVEQPQVEVEQPTVEAEAQPEAAVDQPAVEVEAGEGNLEAEVDPAPVPGANREAEAEATLPADRPQDRDRAARRGQRGERQRVDIDARFSRDLGVRYEAVPQQPGFRISDLSDDGLSARAGFRTGDRVMRVGERQVANWSEFRRAMGGLYGERVPIYVIREGRQMPIYLDLTEHERPAYFDADYSLDRAQRAGFGIGLNKVDNAVVVSRVYPQSPAALAGMRVGDVIISANGREIEEIDEVVGYIRSLTPGDDLVLQVRRAGENLRVASRLATWAEALDTAPPEEVFADRQPEELYFDDARRLSAMEERIRDLEAAVRGLRQEMTQFNSTTRVRTTEPQQRDIESEEPVRDAAVPARPLP